MRIIVMGGAGDVGSYAVECLSMHPGVKLITIADANVKASEQIRHRLKDRRVQIEIKKIDANVQMEIIGCMQGHDIACSALGPFYRFEPKMVKAALEANIDYASVCDEWDAFDEICSLYHRQAYQQNRIILSGLGASPGTTNMAFRYLANQMDTVKKVDIYCYQPLDAGGGPAVIKHMFHIMTGHLCCWRNGEKKSLPALSESLFVEFPKFGRIQLWNMGHAEPLSLPRSHPGLAEVNFFMGFGKGSHLLIWPAKMGFFKKESWVDKISNWLHTREIKKNKPPQAGAIRVDVWGTKSDKPIHRMLCGIGKMRETTGLSLAVGTLMVAQKKLSRTEGGVYSPEACLDPKEFIGAFAQYGHFAYEDLEMKKPLFM